MRHGTALALIALGALALSACAKPTPYVPAVEGFGYAEQPIEAGRYRISFSGNNVTPRETVENFLLYRAAEVTLNSGNDYFVLVQQDTERSTVYRTTGTSYGGAYAPYYGYGRWGYGAGAFGSSTSRPSDSYTAYAYIVVRQGEKPRDDPHAYDARAVLELLGPTVVRPPAS